jgi:uncharacterized membrane protein
MAKTRALRILLVLTGVLPWLAWVLPETAWFGIEQSFSSFCHQRAERSLSLMGKQMPVCSRCAGIFAGIALGTLPAPSIVARYWRRALGIGGIFMLVDVVTQDWVRHAPWHPSRLATGLLLGWILSAGALALIAADDTVRHRSGA